MVSIDPVRCKRCGTCIVSCSESVFEQLENGRPPEVVQGNLCISCGHCVVTCPADAIVHDAFPPGTILPIDASAVPSYVQVRELLRSRRSVRLFKDTPISQDALDAVLDAARLAPSAHNLQEVRYVVVREKAVLEKITESTVGYVTRLAKQIRNPAIRALYRLALSREEIESAMLMLPDFDFVGAAFRKGRDPILHGAPCVLIAYARRSINFPESNAAVALHNAALATHALGLGGFMLGYVVGACKRDKTIPKLLGIPRGHDVYAGLALGHPAIAFPKWIQRRPLEIMDVP